MKRKLKMDDVREGMYITILRGKVEQRVFPTPNGPEIQYKEKDHYNGKVLEVTALDLPYIVVRVHESRGVRSDSLDMRDIEVMAVSPKYIHSLLPDLEIKADPFWDDVQLSEMIDTDECIKEIFKGL